MIETQVGKRYRIGRFVFEVVSLDYDNPPGGAAWLPDLQAWGRLVKELQAEPIIKPRVLSPKQDKTPAMGRTDANNGGSLFD